MTILLEEGTSGQKVRALYNKRDIQSRESYPGPTNSCSIPMNRSPDKFHRDHPGASQCWNVSRQNLQNFEVSQDKRDTQKKLRSLQRARQDLSEPCLPRILLPFGVHHWRK